MGPSDSDFVGIDPGKTGTLINAITSHVSSAQSVAEGYMTQFSRLGLNTGCIHALLSDYSWATGAEGAVMLRRRQSLAEHQPSGDFLKGTDWTTTGAGKLTFPTNAAAASAGKAEGQKLLKELDNGDNVSKDMQALKDNESDVSYMAALFTALGPDGLTKLSAQAKGSSASAKSIAATVGQSLATASYGMNLAKLVPYAVGPSKQYGSMGTEALDSLTPFLSVGTFSSQWLSALAPYVLNINIAEGRGTANGMPSDSDAIWEAIANNPQFAAEYFHENVGLIQQYVTGQGYGLDGVGLGKFLLAATLAPKGDTSPLFKQNAADFVKMFDSAPPSDVIVHAEAVHMAMAMVAINYSADLESTVTAGKSTMGLTAAQWGRFVQNAMESPIAATVLGMYYSQDSSLDNFFATYKPVAQNGTTWKDWLALGLISIPAVIIAAPEDAVAGATAGLSDLAGSAVDASVSAGVRAFWYIDNQLLQVDGKALLQNLASRVLTGATVRKVGVTLIGSSIGTAFSSGTCVYINNYAAQTACFVVVNAASGAAAGFGSTLGESSSAVKGAMISHGTSGATLGVAAPLEVKEAHELSKALTDWINREIPK